MSDEPDDIESFFGPDDATVAPTDPAATEPADNDPDDPTESQLRPKTCEPAEWEKRVQTVLQLLLIGEYRGEIKRRCGSLWDIKPKCVWRYLAEANRRIKDHSESPELDIAEALLHWKEQKKKSGITIQQQERLIGISEKAIEGMLVTIQDIESKEEAETKEQKEILKIRKKSAIDRVGDLRFKIRDAKLLIQSSIVLSNEAQREIQKIKGVMAPIKIARTTADGSDVLNWTPQEIAERIAKLGLQPLPKKLPAPVVTNSPAISSHVPVAEQPIEVEFVQVHKKNGKSNGHTNGYHPQSPPIPPVVNGFGDDHSDL